MFTGLPRLEHSSSQAIVQPRAAVPQLARQPASDALQRRISTLSMWHRALSKPMGRSMCKCLFKSLFFSTWTNASSHASTHAPANANAYASACSYASAGSNAPAYADASTSSSTTAWKLWDRVLRTDATAT